MDAVRGIFTRATRVGGLHRYDYFPDSNFPMCELWQLPAKAICSDTKGRTRPTTIWETPVYYADPERVREELHKILAEARAARAMPWDTQRTALYRTIFPQMTHCLPEEEGEQLRFDFETELARL